MSRRQIAAAAERDYGCERALSPRLNLIPDRGTSRVTRILRVRLVRLLLAKFPRRMDVEMQRKRTSYVRRSSRRDIPRIRAKVERVPTDKFTATRPNFVVRPLPSVPSSASSRLQPETGTFLALPALPPSRRSIFLSPTIAPTVTDVFLFLEYPSSNSFPSTPSCILPPFPLAPRCPDPESLQTERTRNECVSTLPQVIGGGRERKSRTLGVCR